MKPVIERYGVSDEDLLLLQDLLLVIVFVGFLYAGYQAYEWRTAVEENGCKAVCSEAAKQCMTTGNLTGLPGQDAVLNRSTGRPGSPLPPP